MDRRESLELRRPMKWVGASMPNLGPPLPAPPQHEWLEAVKYWNGSGRATVWTCDLTHGYVDINGSYRS
jgi:hypothetical protein